MRTNLTAPTSRPKELTMHPYERWTIRRHLASALNSSHFARPTRADWDIVTWIEDHRRLLDLPELASRTLSLRRTLAIEAAVQLATWKAWRAAAIGMRCESAPKPSPLQKRLDWLARACLLTDGQSRALGLLTRATQTPQVGSLVEAVNGRFGARLEGPDGSDLQPFLETISERVELSASGRLSELGLIEAQDTPRLSVVVRRLLSSPRFEARRVSDLLLGEPARASLAWKDFEHLGNIRDLAARIVAGVGDPKAASRRGVNLLFYGPPGNKQDGIRQDARRPRPLLGSVLRGDGRGKFRTRSTGTDRGALHR